MTGSGLRKKKIGQDTCLVCGIDTKTSSIDSLRDLRKKGRVMRKGRDLSAVL